MKKPDPVKAQIAKERAQATKEQIDDLIRRVREAEARQKFIDASQKAHRDFRLVARERRSGIRELVPVVLASDWHIEEPVTRDSVAGRNEYNLEIADKRIQKFFSGIIWQVEHHRASGRLSIQDMVLWLGGDFFSGYIHPELVESAQLSPTQAVRWLVPRITNGIHTLLETLQLRQLAIPCSYGNHGRTTDKKRISTNFANSFEFLMYHSIADRFESEKRVTMEPTPSNHQYGTVFDKTIHFTHGDEVRYFGGVGGITIPLNKAVSAWDTIRRADVHVTGHFHQLTFANRLVVNGSLIGYGPYSQAIRAAYEPPQQAMFFMDSKRGFCQPAALWVD